MSQWKRPRSALDDDWSDVTHTDTNPAPPPSTDGAAMDPIRPLPRDAPEWLSVVIGNISAYRQELMDFARDLQTEQRAHEKINLAISAKVDAGLDRIMAKMGSHAEADAQDKKFLKDLMTSLGTKVTELTTQVAALKSESQEQLIVLRKTAATQASQLSELSDRLDRLEHSSAVAELKGLVEELAVAVSELSDRIEALERGGRKTTSN